MTAPLARDADARPRRQPTVYLRLWLAKAVAGVCAVLIRLLLWSGGLLLRAADTLMFRSAQWQDRLLPPSLLRDKPSSTSPPRP